MPTTRRRQHQVKEEGEDGVAPAIRSTGQSPRKRPKQEEEEDVKSDQEEAHNPQVYIMDGVDYATYQDMVNAKRERNQQVLKGLGFLDSNEKLLAAASKKAATARGIKKQKTQDTAPFVSRKSSRLSGGKAGLVALDYNVNNWNTNNSVIKLEGGDAEADGGDEEVAEEKFYRDRVNDGSDLTLEEAIKLNDPKWIREDSVELAKTFQKELAQLETTSPESATPKNKKMTSPTSVITKDNWEKEVTAMIEDLSIDKEEWVAKVTPDRIYSVATHPSASKLIACAGDKQGYVGLWDVDAPPQEEDSKNNGVHLFRVHSRPVCCLQWDTPQTMVSASYDSSIRRFHVETGTFEEIFAAYDSDSYYAEDLGYGIDEGHRFWVQSVTVDHRFQGGSNPCLFVATSVGLALHLDLRLAEKQRITSRESLSEKKLNTLR
jgi:hypothetical protein